MSEIGAGAMERSIEATPAERTALAERFGLLSLDGLSATLHLHRQDAEFHLRGHFSATVTQACVASGDRVPARLQEELDIRFVAETPHAPNSEIELTADDCDTLFHDGRVIDLGEAVAQSLALALNPFPRSAKAATMLQEAGVKAEGEEEVGPFAALAALKDKMSKG